MTSNAPNPGPERPATIEQSVAIVAERENGSVFAPGVVFQGRYRLDEPVAMGGMAQVWKAQDLVLQRPVAVKLLHPHLTADPDIVERFRHEAIAAARLSHPNIVPTFDTGTDLGATYIVLGLIEGKSLAAALSNHTFSDLQTCMLGRQIADALDFAHKNGLIHRDIKPSNILLVDNDERVMVADFGIAKVIAESIDPSMTVPGISLGTPAYFAPEQLENGPVGPSIDIFALGILLHEMICGHSVPDVPTQSITSIDLTVPTICPNLPEPIASVITKASQQKVENRYATAGELRDALINVEEQLHEQTPAQPPSSNSSSPPDAPTAAVPTVTRSNKPPLRVKHPVKDVNQARAAAKRRKSTTAIVVFCLIAAAVAVGRVFGTLSTGHSSSSTTTTTPVGLTAATSFDPQGSDHSENQNQTALAIDGNAGTTWSTETYSNRHFGNLKNGVGIELSASNAADLSALTVNSVSNDWSANIYVADQASSTLAGWGHPVTSLSSIQPGTTTFHIDGTKGNQILLWITDLGTSNRVTLSEITLQTR